MSASLETYLDYCKTRVTRARRTVATRTAGSGVIRVSVGNGLHAGNQASISATAFTIGGEADHDLMLLDDGVDGPPVRIDTQSTFLGQLLDISSDRDDVLINGARPVPGSGCEKLPCTIQIGGVDLTLRDDLPEASGPRRPLRQFAAGALLLVAGAAFALSLMPSSQGGAAVLVDHSGPVVPVADTVSLDQRLAEAMDASGLSTYLTLTTGTAGSVNVDGTLPADRMVDWHRLRAELDGAAPSGVVIANVRAAPQLSNLPAIAAVILGDDPRLIYGDGQEAGVGDMMLQHWTIDEITADSFALSREGEQVIVEY